MDGEAALKKFKAMQGTSSYYNVASEPEKATQVLLVGILSELITIKEALNVQANRK